MIQEAYEIAERKLTPVIPIKRKKNGAKFFIAAGLLFAVIVGAVGYSSVEANKQLAIAQEALSNGDFKAARMSSEAAEKYNLVDSAVIKSLNDNIAKQEEYKKKLEIVDYSLSNGEVIEAYKLISEIGADYLFPDDLKRRNEEIASKMPDAISTLTKSISKMNFEDLKASAEKYRTYRQSTSDEKAKSVFKSLLDVAYNELNKRGIATYKAKKYAAAHEILGLFDSEFTSLDFYANYKEQVNEKYQAQLKAESDKQIAEQKAAEKRAAAELAKKKKSEGVTLGMTMEDVLASSWGRPRDVNRSTSAYGTSEQWCYDGYNYLYFDDGILTNIQN